MRRVVIMVSSEDTMCFPTSPPSRVMQGGAVQTQRMAIVSALAARLAEHGVKVENIDEAQGENCFAFVMLGRIETDSINLTKLRDQLRDEGKSLGVVVRIQREELFVAMHRI